MARNTSNIPGLIRLMLVAVAVMVVTGCTPLVRQRTLPPSIRAVHVPMILNRSSEPAIEERLTVALQKELLADGRLRLVKEREADAVVLLTIRDFDRTAFSFDGDDFPTNQLYRIEADMEIRENIPGKPLIGGRRSIVVEQSLKADTRSTSYTAEPDSMEFLYEGFGRVAIQELLTGDYAGTSTTSTDGEEAPEAPAPAVIVPGR